MGLYDDIKSQSGFGVIPNGVYQWIATQDDLSVFEAFALVYLINCTRDKERRLATCSSSNLARATKISPRKARMVLSELQNKALITNVGTTTFGKQYDLTGFWEAVSRVVLSGDSSQPVITDADPATYDVEEALNKSPDIHAAKPEPKPAPKVQTATSAMDAVNAKRRGEGSNAPQAPSEVAKQLLAEAATEWTEAVQNRLDAIAVDLGDRFSEWLEYWDDRPSERLLPTTHYHIWEGLKAQFIKEAHKFKNPLDSGRHARLESILTEMYTLIGHNGFKNGRPILGRLPPGWADSGIATPYETPYGHDLRKKYNLPYNQYCREDNDPDRLKK